MRSVEQIPTDKTALVGYYMDLGIRLVRLNKDRKPLDTEWQKPEVVNHSQAVFEDHVRHGGGLAWQLGEVSGHLAVVDCDWKRAEELAPKFLPETLRAGKGKERPSHYVYLSPGLGYLKLKGLDGSTIIDLKASNEGAGHYVVVEPTEHPTKGQYRFVGGFNFPATETVEAKELERRVRLLALSALIAEHLPPSREEGVGGRHNFALALIGYMLRNGEPAEDVEKVLVAAWEVRGDPREGPEDIRRSIPDSVARLARDDRVTGGPSLEEAVPKLPERIAKILDWSGWDMSEKRKSYMRTDLGNAERLVDADGGDMKWCTERRCWMRWDGKRWCWDEGGHSAHRLAHKCVRSIFGEAENAADDQEAKAIAAHAVASQSASRIEALLSQAKPYLNMSMEDLDLDAWLVNAGNGTLDLRTGELRGHRRDDLITKAVPFDYDPEARAPRFLEFMDQVLPDPEVRAFVQRYAGYSLTGSTAERVLAFLHGGGKNGKSTLVEALREAAGEYARNTTVETILSSRGGSQIPNDVAALKGARLVSAAEPEKNRRMAESKVKNLTGSDTVTARFMRGEFFDFKPEFKLWISMNHKPIIVGTDDAIWDRIRLIPFNQRFADNPDTGLPAKLAEERAGIFAWMVRGALDWCVNGLGCPEAVAAATEEYREAMDTLGDFLEARCVVDPNATAPAAALYTQYGMWCDDTGERKETQTAFGARLAERGFESFKFTSGPNKDRKGWRGIGVRADSSDPDSPPENGGGGGNLSDGGSQGQTGGSGADSCTSGKNGAFAGKTPSRADSADSSGPKTHINNQNPARERAMQKTGPQPSALSAAPSPYVLQAERPDVPNSYLVRAEDGAVGVEQAKVRGEVHRLFQHPPSWLPPQVGLYLKEPARYLDSLCASVASVLGYASHDVPDDVRLQVGRELEAEAEACTGRSA